MKKNKKCSELPQMVRNLTRNFQTKLPFVSGQPGSWVGGRAAGEIKNKTNSLQLNWGWGELGNDLCIRTLLTLTPYPNSIVCTDKYPKMISKAIRPVYLL